MTLFSAIVYRIERVKVKKSTITLTSGLNIKIIYQNIDYYLANYQNKRGERVAYFFLVRLFFLFCSVMQLTLMIRDMYLYLQIEKGNGLCAKT